MTKGLIFAFDLETTSVDPDTTTPAQICLMSEQDGVRRVLMNSLVRPGELIQPGAQKVHGISDAMVQSASDYVIAAWMAHLLYREMLPGHLLSYNGKLFDEPILDRCLGSSVFPGVTHIDLLDVAYRFFPTLPSHKLGRVYAELVGSPLENAHNACADVNATLDLLRAICVKIGMTLEQLTEEMATPKPYVIFPMGAHQGKLIHEIPRGYGIWALNSFKQIRPDLKLTLESIASGEFK